MATGKVKWFNNAKGYGFVLADEGNEDLFVHYSSIEMNGYRTLRADQEVTFDIQQGPKGLHAVNVCATADEPGVADLKQPPVETDSAAADDAGEQDGAEEQDGDEGQDGDREQDGEG